jgi:hypothetical protein
MFKEARGFENVALQTTFLSPSNWQLQDLLLQKNSTTLDPSGAWTMNKATWESFLNAT